ncbi:hypothetical protein HMF8227_00068 [Saliniradius amylolyticus]|uniref:Flagellar protein FliL n=1 Tax=Saliniradius amylolyticus TaxID=2183582 RepID=A0A2S2DYX6_9ALTE|nr:hypothetical protein HMF8227_00068 [Saliniradius amylolyticus]
MTTAMLRYTLFAIVTLVAFASPKAHATAYFGLEPDIVTNYLGQDSKKLGFVRVSIELMLEDASYLEVAQHHTPLMRATAIDIFGQQPENKVKSLVGREEIRKDILRNLRNLMEKETGAPMIEDVIFTKYLYQGS